MNTSIYTIIKENVSFSERDRQISYGITYLWNLKYDPNEFVYETEIDRLIDKENRLMIAKGEEGLGV